MAEAVYLQVSFAIIAVLALTSNAAFCIVLLRDKRLLNTACNVLLLSLAITDMITGISLFLTPAYIIDPAYFTIPRGALGDFFCRIIFSQCLVFTLGIVSVYTLTFMAVERWYAVTRPHQYKKIFARNRKHVYVAAVWVWSCLLNSPHALEMELATHNASAPTCAWVTTISNENARHGVAVLEFLFKYLLPVVVTLATFIHLQFTVRKPGCQFLRRNGNAGLRLLRMCTFTASALAVCWAPNQIYYLLFKFNLNRLNVPAHHVTVIMCMFNSCINPWIYCATNKTYRRKFTNLARICFQGSQVNCDVTTSGVPQDISTATGAEKAQTVSTTDRASSEKYKSLYDEGGTMVTMTSEKKYPEVNGAASNEIELSDVRNLCTTTGNPTPTNVSYDGTVLRDIESPSIEETRT